MALNKTPQGLTLNVDLDSIARSLKAREELKNNAQNRAAQQAAADVQKPSKPLNMYDITPDKGRFLNIIA